MMTLSKAFAVFMLDSMNLQSKGYANGEKITGKMFDEWIDNKSIVQRLLSDYSKYFEESKKIDDTLLIEINDKLIQGITKIQHDDDTILRCPKILEVGIQNLIKE